MVGSHLGQLSPVGVRYYGNYPHVCEESYQFEQEEEQTVAKGFLSPVGSRLGLSIAGTHAGVGGLGDKDWVLLAPPAAWTGIACSKENPALRQHSLHILISSPI